MRICFVFCVLVYAVFAHTQIADLENSLQYNRAIKQLEYQIKALEEKAKAKAKWDNPSLSLVYSNAEILQPFNFNANDMQNMGIGIAQNIDISGKRILDSHTTKLEAQSKILELKNLKNQYTLALLQGAITAHKNKSILKLMQDSITNIDTLLRSLQKSNNFNAMQLQKLRLLKARLEIKRNELQNELENAHIAMSIASFGHSSFDSSIDFTDIPISTIDALQDEKFLDEIMQNNYEIAIANIQYAMSVNEAKTIKRGIIPDLKVNFSYMIRVDRNDMFSFGVSMPMPIFGKEIAQINEAKYNSLTKENQVLEVRNKIKHSAMALLSKMKALQNNLAIINATLLPANKQIIKLYQHHSTSQSGAFLEFYTALNEQIDTEILKLQVLSDIAITYYNLKSLRGEI